MAQLTSKTNHPCWGTFPCFYRQNNLCAYWIQVEVILEKWAQDDPGNRKCYQNMINSLREPCRELDEEGRRRGIEDMLGLSE